MVCITVPTTGSAANADIQTNDSLDGVHDVNTLEFIDSLDFSVLMAMNKQNGLDINLDTVITPSNATDHPLTVNDSTDHTLFIVKNNREVVAEGFLISNSGVAVRDDGVDKVNLCNNGQVIATGNVLAPSLTLQDPTSVTANPAADFVVCKKGDATKVRVDGNGNVTAKDTTVNDLTSYNAHVNGVLNEDGGLNVRDNGVNKFIVLSEGNVFCKAPITTQSVVIQDPQEGGSNLYGDYIVGQAGDNDTFRIDNTASLYATALQLTNPDLTF